VVIVGGGTAGWMCAAALVGAVRPGVCEVRLVESDEIGIVGVGEATLPQIKEFNEYIGVIEADFMRKTNATFKLGIEFVDWGFKGSSYIHPFGVHGKPMGGVPFYQYWTKARQGGRTDDIEDFCLPIVASRLNRFDFPTTDEGGINSTFAYAYHFDANLYAGFLREFSEARGLRRTEGKVVDVTLRAQDGHIAAITLNSGEVIEGDLFIDCSGFASLLLGRALKEPFVDFSHWLPVDGAWACPCERVGEALTPYTRATALEGGWAWRIPLQSRTGHGHVFSSRYIDPDAARTQLMAQLDGKPLAEPRLLRFSTGHRERFWVRNVVALGLSSGFLEPLESTSIFLIQTNLAHLMTLLEAKAPIDEAAIDAFNARGTREFRRIRDFILLHYCLTARRDSALWRDMATMDLPETLAYKIELWRHHGVLHQQQDEGFDETSWLAIHAGMRHWPRRTDPVLEELPLDHARDILRQRREAIARAVAPLPPHHAYLARLMNLAQGAGRSTR
jgi:tryptophan halogenase